MKTKYPPEAIDQWPSVRYGPDGAWEIFQSAKDVPAGWEDHPSKVKEPKAKKSPPTEPIDL